MKTWKQALVEGLVAAAMMLPVVAMAGKDGHGKHDHGKAHGGGAMTSVRGEVIDISCYMAHEGKGKKHAKCAENCIVNLGLPIGILTDDGKVVLIIEDHGNKKAYAAIKKLAAKKVSARGKMYSKGGMPTLAIHGVNEL